MFPNQNRLNFIEIKKKIWNVQSVESIIPKIVNGTGFKRFIWEHENKYLRYNNAKKIICTYRNPLDLIVSRYFYNYKNRTSHDQYISHPRDLINEEIKKFSRE